MHALKGSRGGGGWVRARPLLRFLCASLLLALLEPLLEPLQLALTTADLPRSLWTSLLLALLEALLETLQLSLPLLTDQAGVRVLKGLANFCQVEAPVVEKVHLFVRDAEVVERACHT